MSLDAILLKKLGWSDELVHTAEWVLDETSTRDLLEAMAECDRGEVVSAEEVFAALPPR